MVWWASSQLFSGTLQQHLILEKTILRGVKQSSYKMIKPTHNLKFSVTLGMAAFLNVLKTFQKANCSKHISVVPKVHFLFAVLPQQLTTGRINLQYSGTIMRPLPCSLPLGAEMRWDRVPLPVPVLLFRKGSLALKQAQSASCSLESRGSVIIKCKETNNVTILKKERVC